MVWEGEVEEVFGDLGLFVKLGGRLERGKLHSKPAAEDARESHRECLVMYHSTGKNITWKKQWRGLLSSPHVSPAYYISISY